MTNRIVDFPDSYTSGTTPTITDPNLTAHLNDTTDAHDASAISNVPSGNLAATDVQAALNELQGDIDSLGSGAVEVAQDAIAAALAAGTQDGATLTYDDGLNKYDLTNTDKGSVAVASHESDVTAHPASSIVNTPSGNLAATEVQAALNELQSDIDTRATSSALSAHIADTANPHAVTKSQVGLGNVDNTSDATKNSAVATLTNKTIDGGSNTLQNIPGSALNNGEVTNAKLANVSTATIKGRTTAGTGSPEDLTATQATALLNGFVGDSGSGGTKGLVPAPAAGDAAANKFLKADGTWSASGGGGTPASVSDQANTSTGYFSLPRGTTAQRPGSPPQSGLCRMNTDNNQPEWYDSVNGIWVEFADGRQYDVEALIVAGGGGGGGGDGGGGGAGGYRIVTGQTVKRGTGYTVTIGAGGAPDTSGSNSVFDATTSTAGGRGGTGEFGNGPNGSSGGSGGGGAGSVAGSGGSGTAGQGNAGGSGNGAASAFGGAGGGGAGAVGGNGSGSAGGAGGVGLSDTWTGSTRFLAGGGGGSSRNANNGAGGNGGGGAGVANNSGTGTNGDVNTGGGGGGGRDQVGNSGGSGGSGIVVIRYRGSQKGTGGTITSSGGYTLHTFTSSGTFTA